MHTRSVNDPVIESPDHIDNALREFGVSPEQLRARRAPSGRFLEMLSGRDPLRVMRAGYDWWER